MNLIILSNRAPVAPRGQRERCLIQMLRVMRLTAMVLLGMALHVSAKVASQTVTLSVKKAPLNEVFNAVKRQTGFVVFYNVSLLEKSRPVTLKAEAMPLTQFLSLALKSQDLEFTIENKTIVINRRVEQPVTVIPAAPVKGVVRDAEGGYPLVGATIRVKGKAASAVTDEQGAFTIDAVEGDVLVISYVGFEKKEFKIGAGGEVSIGLKRAQSLIDTVVISTGYSQRKASEFTGAVQTIRGEELRSGVSGANTLAMLKGKATGLYILEQGGSVANRGQVVIRGQSSFNDASNTNFGPLIVVDGVVTNAANLQDIINANDIESINILKDAASTAIYGSRAAQGVLVVVTRRGHTNRTSVNLSMNYGKVQNNRLMRFMNTGEITTHIRKSMERLYAANATLQNNYGSFDNYYNTTRPFTDEEMKNSTQWDNTAFFTDGLQSDINLSVSGGTEKTKFYTAISWTDQDGTLLDDNMDRKAIRINLDHRFNDKLSFALNTNVLYDQYTATTSENQYYILQPWVTPYYASGELADSIPNYIYNATGPRRTVYYDNPLYSHTYNTRLTNRLNLFGSGVLRYKILPWLSVQSTNSINYTNNDVNAYRDPRTYRGRYDGAANSPVYMNGQLQLNQTISSYFLTSNLLTVQKRLGDHELSAVAGQEYGRFRSKNSSAKVYNTPYPGERNLGAFLNFGDFIDILIGWPVVPTSLPPVDKASFSIFSEVNDSYKGKYFASASIRRDASTNFGRNNRYGNFYAVSGGWLVSREMFFNVKPVSLLKLRASYGTSGREAGADYLNFSTYKDDVFYSDNAVGSSISQLANDNITWETTYTTNVGFDLGLWNRVTLNVDLYNRNSRNLLQSVLLPSYIGFTSQYANVGALRNRGLDIRLVTENIKRKDFGWTMDFNISFNKNRLVALKGDSLLDNFSRNYYRHVGEDVNVLKAVKYVGVDPDNGHPLFEKLLGNGKTELVDSLPLARAGGLSQFQTVGSSTPKFFGGWSSDFRYKNFHLSVLFNFSYGNKIMNNSLRNFLDPTLWQSGFNLAQPSKDIRFWKGPGDTDANYPDFYDPAFSQRGATNLASSLIYVDASYLRLRNVRLGYDLPKTFLSRFRISSLNVYASADNVFVIKSKELYAADPEGATIGSTSTSYAGTGMASAMPRRFLIGLSAGF